MPSNVICGITWIQWIHIWAPMKRLSDFCFAFQLFYSFSVIVHRHSDVINSCDSAAWTWWIDSLQFSRIQCMWRRSSWCRRCNDLLICVWTCHWKLGSKYKQTVHIGQWRWRVPLLRRELDPRHSTYNFKHMTYKQQSNNPILVELNVPQKNNNNYFAVVALSYTFALKRICHTP